MFSWRHGELHGRTNFAPQALAVRGICDPIKISRIMHNFVGDVSFAGSILKKRVLESNRGMKLLVKHSYFVFRSKLSRVNMTIPISRFSLERTVKQESCDTAL